MGIIDTVFKPVGDLLNVSPVVAMILCLVLLVAIVVLIIVIVVVKKKRKNVSRAMSPASREEIAASYQFFDGSIKVKHNQNSNKYLEDNKMNKDDKKTATVKKDTKEVKATAKTATKAVLSKVVAKTVTAKTAKKVVGKWYIEHKSDDEYLSKLVASNGEVMLTSEIYKSEDGAEAGISSIIRGIENGKKLFPIMSQNPPYLCNVKTRQALLKILTIPH